MLELIRRPEEYISGYPLHTWYRGIVEDVNDPEKRGRVRVRVESVYKSAPGSNKGSGTDKTVSVSLAAPAQGQDKNDAVRKDELPWADVICHGQANKVGHFFVPRVNDAVIVVFEFGQPEYPLVIGGWWGQVNPNGNDTNAESEAPLAALGGSQEGETGNDKKGKDGHPAPIKTAQDVGTIQEPDNPYDAQYPENQVIRTSSGHLLELDNTSGAERINIVHKSGTWAEFHPDGTLVFGIQGKRYTLVEQDDDQHVKGKRNVVIDGDMTHKVGGGLTTQVVGDVSDKVNGKHTEETAGEHIIKSTGALTLQSVGGKTTVKANTKIVQDAPVHEINATGTYSIVAPQINLSAVAGGAIGDVVTTVTHPIDYITGIPILGVSNVRVG